jgi:hypothetical protein
MDAAEAAIGSETRLLNFTIFKGSNTQERPLRSLISETVAMMPLQSSTSLCPIVGYKIYSGTTELSGSSAWA